jgi:hypothetical protein
MEDSSLTTDKQATPVTQDTGTQVTPPAVTAPAVAPKADGTPPAPAGWDYKADPRWGKVFKSESDIINGYKSLDDILETKYKPTFKQYTDLAKKFKDNGIELEKLDDYIKEFQTLKSPEYPANQVYDYLKELSDDDITAQELDLALKELHEKKMARKYPGATKETLARMVEQEKQLKELTTFKSTLEQKELTKQSTERTEKAHSSIQELCKTKGFEFTDKIWNEFIDHCIQNKIPSAYMVQEFRSKYDAMIDKVHEEKIKAQQLETLKQTNATTIPVKGKQTIVKPVNTSFEEKIKAAFTKSKPPAT